MLWLLHLMNSTLMFSFHELGESTILQCYQSDVKLITVQGALTFSPFLLAT